MKRALLIALMSLATASLAQDFPASPIKVWIQPMAGLNTLGFAQGLGLSASRGIAMGSVRLTTAKEFCICTDPAGEMTRTEFLAGLKHEGSLGYVAILSGLSREEGIARKDFAGYDSFSDPEYPHYRYSEFGVPLVVDAALTNRFVGLGFSLAFNMSETNPGGGFFLHLPFGLIRDGRPAHGPSAPGRAFGI